MNYVFRWEKIFSGRYLDWLIEGLCTSLNLIIVSAVIAVFVGVLCMYASISKKRPLSIIANAYIELCRNIPTLIWVLFFYFVFPKFFPDPIQAAINSSDYLKYWSAIAALSLSSSGYISEILRGGVVSVPREQVSAAYALGHSRPQIWVHVIWPQALRNCFPALMNRLIHNTQNTSLAMAISVHEIMWATQQIESMSFCVLETMIIATLFYLIVCNGLSLAGRIVERRLLPACN